MKKKILAFVFIISLVLSSFGMMSAENLNREQKNVLLLPSLLLEVEEDAFSGTAVETVVFPKGFLHIGENAFSGSGKLTDIYIPESTDFIADSAFSMTRNLTIHSIDDSYAKEWAEKHRVPFVVDNIWDAISQDGSSMVARGAPMVRYIAAVNPEKLIAVHDRGENEGKSMRPQDRPELNPIDYRFP